MVIVISVFRKADFEANDFYVAMIGDTFDWIVQNQGHMIPYILIKGTIFARMSPENKEHFIIRHHHYYVTIAITSYMLYRHDDIFFEIEKGLTR